MIATGDFSHIQFPQAYRSTPGSPLAAELTQYFDTFARASSGTCSMLLTGTMSVIRKDSLVEAGGWPVDSITEDARLGVRLLALGGKGIFVDEIHGTGILPGSLSCLSKQRSRWAEGNACVLRRALTSEHLPARHRVSVIGQLCAWLQGAYLLIPAILLASIFQGGEYRAGLLVAAFVGLLFVEAWLAFQTARGDVGMRLKVAGIRFAMSREGFRGLWGLMPFRRPVFVRTLKSALPGGCRNNAIWFGISFYSALAVVALGLGYVALTVVTLIFVLRGVTRLWLAKQLSEPAPVFHSRSTYEFPAAATVQHTEP